MAYTIKQVSEASGATIRALQHYDRIGLLRPASRSSSGYRLYQDEDLLKLQQLLLLKSMGFGLKDIACMLSDAATDREAALRRHRGMLIGKLGQMNRLIGLVDRSLEAIREGRKEMMKELFEGFDHEGHKQEAKRLYGEAFEESERRASKYDRKQWEQFKAEQKQLMEDILSARAKGPEDSMVLDLMGRHRATITKWFYDCTLDIFDGLADLYVQDARFTKTYEDIAPGLAGFMSASMKAYVKREQNR